MKKSLVIFITTAIILILAIGGLKLFLAPYSQNNPNQNMAKNESNNTRVLLETNYGNITVELRADQPITAGNFKSLVEEGTYNGVIFHRIIPKFMIQGGDPTGTGYGDPSIPKIKDEFNGEQKNNRGTLAMANAGPNTGSSQFFINLVNNNFLDGKHPVFANVVQGMDVVDEIAAVKTGANDKPIKPVTIIKASVL
jgi:peptidylprolyl isomerase